MDGILLTFGIFGIIVLIWTLRGKLLLPVKPIQDLELTAVLRVKGSTPELENTVNALEYLRENGTLPANILIIDAGMDSETRRIANLLARRKLIAIEDSTINL